MREGSEAARLLTRVFRCPAGPGTPLPPAVAAALSRRAVPRGTPAPGVAVAAAAPARDVIVSLLVDPDTRRLEGAAVATRTHRPHHAPPGGCVTPTPPAALHAPPITATPPPLIPSPAAWDPPTAPPAVAHNTIVPAPPPSLPAAVRDVAVLCGERASPQAVVTALYEALCDGTATVQVFVATEADRRELITFLLGCAEDARSATECQDTQFAAELHAVLRRVCDGATLLRAAPLAGLPLHDLFAGSDHDAKLATKKELAKVAWRLGVDPGGLKKDNLAEALAAHLTAEHGAGMGLSGPPADRVARLLRRRHAAARRPPLLTSLERAAGTLYALPCVGFPTLADVSQVAGGVLPSDAVLLAARPHRLAEALRQRTDGAFRLLDHLRSDPNCRSQLCAAPAAGAPPVWPAAVRDPLLQRLLYFKQAEMVAQAEAARGVAAPALQVRREGAAWVLSDSDVGGIEAHARGDAEFQIGHWVAVPVERAAELARFPDAAFCDAAAGGCATAALRDLLPDLAPHALALCDVLPNPAPEPPAYMKRWVQDRPLATPDGHVLGTLRLHFPKNPEAVGHGAKWVEQCCSLALRRRFVDFNGRKAVRALLNTVSGSEAGESLFIDLIRHGPPEAETEEVTTSETDEEESTAFLGLTSSQQVAYRHALRRRVQLVWGPPGTGKSFYLATAVLLLVARAKRRGSKTYHVLVSAHAKPAIHDLLAAAARLRDALAETDPTGWWRCVHVGSLAQKAWTDPIGKTWRRGAAKPEYAVVGCTVWEAHRWGRYSGPGVDYTAPSCVDVLAIDEGSQMLAADAAPLVNRLRPETGRLIVVGDHLQLPPIVSNPALSGVDVAGSIFLALMRTADGAPLTDRFATAPLHNSVVKLTENLRSNSTICALSQTLYGTDYHVPASQPPKTLRLSAAPLPAPVGGYKAVWGLGDAAGAVAHTLATGGRPWWKGLLTVVVDAVPARADALRVEAAALAAVAEAVRRVSAPSDWGAHTIVVAPSKAQCVAVREEAEAFPAAQVPFSHVDTVNRTQGKTADVVHIAYSVPTSSDFMYDIARLNVAFTRARCMNILYVSAATLHPPHTVCAAFDTRLGAAHLDAFLSASAVLKLSFPHPACPTQRDVACEWLLNGSS
eukprot:TRINITY_DN2818_c0_g1_i1.p1 TRINITY_DN2818_c0_g1~~TRINITY_DN2818_c0_g1_i1.p1  ORF type:complete len:1129 (+),score=283.21 TRINITY_DN2818_c0_g1_i1:924-4310(+)